jgi:hypothetical protein
VVVTNDAAFDGVSIMDVKSFIIPVPGANPIKLYTAVIYRFSK